MRRFVVMFLALLLLAMALFSVRASPPSATAGSTLVRADGPVALPWAFTATTTLTTTPEALLIYHVHITPAAPGRMEAILEGVDAESITFYMAQAFMGNVSAVEAASADGAPLEITPVSGGWQVSTAGSGTVILRYLFGPSFETPGTYWSYKVCYIASDAAVFRNDTVFVYPEIPIQTTRVVFDVPSEWTVGTHLLPEAPDTFRVEGVPDLKTDLLAGVTRMARAMAVA